MVEQNLFIETLREVSEIVRTAPEPPTRQEIMQYFDGMELTGEQREMIWQYLSLPAKERTGEGIAAGADTEKGALGENKAAGRDTEHADAGAKCGAEDYACTSAAGELDLRSDEESRAEAGSAEDKTQASGEEIPIDSLSDSAFYRMYLEEVRALDAGSQDLNALYERLLDGEQSVCEEITAQWLMRVIGMARLYRSEEVNAQDLIQEGNMALWIALNELSGELRAAQLDYYLTEKIQGAMQDYVREITGGIDKTQAVLAKAGLLYEAQKLLTEENASVPSLRELSDYTQIPAEEIRDILALQKSAEDQA